MSSLYDSVWKVLLGANTAKPFIFFRCPRSEPGVFNRRQLGGILPLKAVVAMDTVAFVGLWPFKHFKGEKRETLARPLTT